MLESPVAFEIRFGNKLRQVLLSGLSLGLEYRAAMIHKERIKELLSLPVDERRRLLRLLQESLPREAEQQSQSNRDQPSPAAKWLLSISGRYSGGPGDTAHRADEILRAEIDKQSGLTTK